MESEQVRLDYFLSQSHPEISRAQLQKLIKLGNVKVDKIVTTKPSTKVSLVNAITIDLPELTLDRPLTLELPVIYEDSQCVVIDKPVGVLVHSKGAYNPEATVASWLSKRDGFDFLDSSDRSGIVHRLDRATSGVMICAKNRQALGHLQKQFQTRKAKKAYRARVSGHLQPIHALLDLPIERNPKKPQTFRVGTNGKSAQTEYEVIRQIGSTDYIELKPVTGRTHQLRVHMVHIGHPIVGDTLYGGQKASRMYLHASRLEITLPDSTRKVFTAEVPVSFTKENML